MLLKKDEHLFLVPIVEDCLTCSFACFFAHTIILISEKKVLFKFICYSLDQSYFLLKLFNFLQNSIECSESARLVNFAYVCRKDYLRTHITEMSNTSSILSESWEMLSSHLTFMCSVRVIPTVGVSSLK